MTYSKLLRNRKVIDEINRHRWIESEKAGCDIGFELASVDWLQRFSRAWMDYHMPHQTLDTANEPEIFQHGKSSHTKTSPNSGHPGYLAHKKI